MSPFKRVDNLEKDKENCAEHPSIAQSRMLRKLLDLVSSLVQGMIKEWAVKVLLNMDVTQVIVYNSDV